MAIKTLHTAPPRGAARRVDDVVARTRVSAAGVSVLSPVQDSFDDFPEFDAFLADFREFERKATSFAAVPAVREPRPLRIVEPIVAAPEPKGGTRSAASDPAFKRDVEVACELATSVRSPRTHVEPSALESLAAPVASPVAAPEKYRFTNRGLRVLVALGFALSILIGGAIGAVMAEAPGGGETTIVTVHPGDSLWSIASSLTAPGEDVRSVVHEISELNGLDSSVITAGQNLVVPVR